MLALVMVTLAILLPNQKLYGGSPQSAPGVAEVLGVCDQAVDGGSAAAVALRDSSLPFRAAVRMSPLWQKWSLSQDSRCSPCFDGDQVISRAPIGTT